MTDPSKIKETHTQRAAVVYLRQSTLAQVEHNRESTARQYALADKACQLGWSKEQVAVIDEDLGLSGSSADKRSASRGATCLLRDTSSASGASFAARTSPPSSRTSRIRP